MNSIVFISDTHIGPNRYFGYDVIESAFQDAIDLAKQTNSMTLVHCGDLFDKRVVTSADLDCFARVYEYLVNVGVKMIVVEGNHGKDRTGSSVVRHYKSYVDPEVFVSYSSPQVIELQGASLLLCPFGHNMTEAVPDLVDEAMTSPVLVGHCDVVGADYGEATSKMGLTPSEMIEIMGQVEAIVLGHIHKPQHLGGVLQAAFVGAPCQFNFRACGQTRGFAKLNLDSFELVHVPWDGGPTFTKINPNDDISTVEVDGAFIKAIRHVGSDIDDCKDKLLARGANPKWLSVVEERIVLPVVRKTTMRPNDPVATIAEKYLDMRGVIGKDRDRLINVHRSIEES